MTPQRTPTTRRHVYTLWTCGLNKRAIARQTSIPEATVRRYIRQFNQRGHSYCLDRPGPARKLDDRQERMLIRQIIQFHREPWTYHAKNWDISSATMGAIADRHGLHRRIMRRKPWLSPKNIERRRQWARDNIGRDWRSVIFTDESSIELGGKAGRQRTSRRAGEAYLPKHVQPTFQSSRQTMMVWGAIAYKQIPARSHPSPC